MRFIHACFLPCKESGFQTKNELSEAVYILYCLETIIIIRNQMKTEEKAFFSLFPISRVILTRHFFSKQLFFFSRGDSCAIVCTYKSRTRKRLLILINDLKICKYRQIWFQMNARQTFHFEKTVNKNLVFNHKGHSSFTYFPNYL